MRPATGAAKIVVWVSVPVSNPFVLISPFQVPTTYSIPRHPSYGTRTKQGMLPLSLVSWRGYFPLISRIDPLHLNTAERAFVASLRLCRTAQYASLDHCTSVLNPSSRCDKRSKRVPQSRPWRKEMYSISFSFILLHMETSRTAGEAESISRISL